MRDGTQKKGKEIMEIKDLTYRDNEDKQLFLHLLVKEFEENKQRLLNKKYNSLKEKMHIIKNMSWEKKQILILKGEKK